MPNLEVKTTADGKILARRKDRLPLTQEDREEAKRIFQAEYSKYGITLDDVLSTFFTEEEQTGWLYLEVQMPEKYPPGPIVIGPRASTTDPEKFAEATIQDLVTYIVSKNRGSSIWVKRVLDEKLEQLGRCGVTVEIKPVQ